MARCAVTRDWGTDNIRGGLRLSMRVEVNGQVHQSDMVMDAMMQRYGGPPAEYIERDIRRQLMHSVEKQLFGE